jgi:hypothetical protein
MLQSRRVGREGRKCRGKPENGVLSQHLEALERVVFKRREIAVIMAVVPLPISAPLHYNAQPTFLH